MVWKRFLLFALLISMALYYQLFFLWGKELQKISLEEVLSIGSLDDDALFQWVGVVADSRNYIYVTDAMDYTLKKFDSQGNIVKKTGRKGQGPGEFLALRLLDSSEDFLYITDQFIPGIQVFDKDLNYKSHIPLKIPISDLKIISDNRIAVATLSADKTGRIFIFDGEGRIFREFEYSSEKLPYMMDMVSFDFDFSGNLYLAYSFQDRIEKFDYKGKKLWSKELLGIKKVKRKKISSFVVPTEVVYKDVDLDNAGNLFVLGGHLSKNRSRDVYVISPEGEHLASFTLPDTSHCIHIDSQNFLYSRANEGVTLKKFKMHYIYK